MKRMEGLSAVELGNRLGRLPDTVKKQLRKHGIKPTGYIGPTAIYPYSSEDAIRNIAPVGRPRKQKAEKPEDK